MAFAAPALAAIGGGSVAAGAATAATLAATAYGAAQQAKAAKAAAQASQVTTPEKPVQATKAPERQNILAGMAAASRAGGSLAGNASTFLTGSEGVDPAGLNLGKNKLFGQ